MARKKNESGGFVYSTDPNFNLDEETEESIETLPPGRQDLRLHRQRLKGNKVVTTVKGFEGATEDLKELGKQLKSHCGCGGSVKDGEILLQGDVRDRAGAELERLGYRFKMSGG